MSLVKAPQTFRSRIIYAGSWVLAGHVVSQVLRLVGNLILTRLLVPEMFGILAVANIFLVGLALFSDFGLQPNIIQSKRGDEPIFLNTIWTVQIIRGGVIWMMACGLALALYLMNAAQLWPINSVYAEPILPYVIVVISFNAVINGFDSTKIATVNRNLSLGILTRIELLSQLAGLTCMVVWAYIDRSIWSLVMSTFVTSTLKMILSHVWIPGIRNNLYWDKDVFKDIFHFGKWIFVASIVGFLAMNGDRILLGSLVAPQILGIYVIAFYLVEAFRLVLDRIVGSVIFPSLSEVVRNGNIELRGTYYRMRLPIDIVSLMGAGFVFASGSLIIEILYDDRYMMAGHMMEVLCVSMIGIRYTVTGALFLAMGKPQLLLAIALMRLLPLYILLPMFYSLFGLDGALWISGGSILFSLPIVFYFKIKYSILDIAKEIYTLPLLIVGYILGLLANYFYAIL